MLVIFLNNKIISCDSIIPLALEFRDRFPERKIIFITFENRTLNALKDNTVIWNVMQSCGKIFSVDTRSSNKFNLIYNLVRIVSMLSYIGLRTLVSKTVFIHFKILRERPFYFFYLINKKRTFFFESEPFTESTNQKLQSNNFVRHNKFVSDRPSAEFYVTTTDRWNQVVTANKYGKKLIIIPPLKSSKLWVKYIDSISNEYFPLTNGQNNNEPIITFFLGTLDKLDYIKIEVSKLLIQTLDVLDKLTGDIKVFLKPHMITDINLLKEILKNRDQNKYVISYLHPSVLASRSVFVICNYYTTAIIDSYLRGVPSIEYTNYEDKLLTLTNHRTTGLAVNYFINNDLSRLCEAIHNIINNGTIPTDMIDRKLECRPPPDFEYLFELLSK